MEHVRGDYLFLEMGYIGGSPEGGSILFHCDSKIGLAHLCSFLAESLQKTLGEESELSFDLGLNAQVESWSPHDPKNWGLADKIVVVLVEKQSEASVEMFPDSKCVKLLSTKDGVQYLLEICVSLDNVERDKEVIMGGPGQPIALGHRSSKEGILAQVMIISASQTLDKIYNFNYIFL